MKTLAEVNLKPVLNSSLRPLSSLLALTSQPPKKEIKEKAIRLPGLCQERTNLWFSVALVLLLTACL